MKVSVIGCGYLGAVHAAALASLGHEVIGMDLDEAKVDALASGNPPFYEPGLSELLLKGQDRGSLEFTTEVTRVASSILHFVCVGTPQKPGELAADVTYVNEAVESLLPYLTSTSVVVGKSTVPVGTAERLAGVISGTGASMVWNPEFLREGHAVEDTVHPNRLVYGVAEGEAGQEAATRLDEVYASMLAEDTPRIITDYATAELVKTAANSFLATKISFINAMAELCEASGADVTQLADAIGLDDRIGRKFLNAGLGFGGGCLPKDIRAFMARAGELGADQAVTFLKEIDSINMRRRVRMVDIARDALNGSFIGKKITVLGAAFKPNSDDVRDSPALAVARLIATQGGVVTVTDPQAIGNASTAFPELNYVTDTTEALTGADAVLLLTEWHEYRDLDPHVTAESVNGKVLVDGRNVLTPQLWRAAGWTYRALGRP
ncbi:UDP-glucose dehydrogenase family protein [Brevibacterium sp. FAM 24630]|uniref:UDP-glucose dehydrogenase family protein n=1 Tax=Brevibacterium sp. FAM 24630 TaxID=3415680 RepID=UPI003C7DCA4C